MRDLALAIGLASVLLLAGCQSPPVEVPPAPVAEPDGWTMLAGPACQSCYEPTAVQVPGGRIVVATANGAVLQVSDDGGQGWMERPVPQLPQGFPGGRGDGTLFLDPDGRLWYLALGLTGQGLGLAQAFVFLGLQVARSDDGGETWATNEFLGLPEGIPEGALQGAERPWLAFGPGAVHVVYPHWPTSVFGPGTFNRVSDGLWIATSRDDGASFEDPVRISDLDQETAIPGRPVVDGDGALHVPYLAYSRTGSAGLVGLFVATSADAGRTFDTVRVDPDPGSRFPALAQDPGGGWWIAWLRDGATRLARSGDGTTWDASVTVNEGESQIRGSPWMQAGPDGVMRLTWTEEEAAGGLVLLEWPAGSDPALGLRHDDLATNGTLLMWTDFIQFMHGGDGRLLLPVPDDEGGAIHLLRGPRLVPAGPSST